jgi:small subunit ribosomal protein S3
MGQKVNPNLFRLGISREYASQWFISPKRYCLLMKEDFGVRDYFREEVIPFVPESRIKELKIIRKLKRRLEVIIVAERPEAEVFIEDCDDLVSYLKAEMTGFRGLLKTFPVCKEIRFRIRKEQSGKPRSHLVALSIGKQLECRVDCGKVLRQVLKNLSVRGAKLQVSGRLRGQRRSRRMCLRSGRVPLHTLDADIDYAMRHVETRNGVLGVKVWLFREGEGIRVLKKA